MFRTLPIYIYIVLLLILVGANIYFYRQIFAPRELTVVALDVGKGSATLVRTPGGTTILIDTGPDASIVRALGLNLPEWQRSIDDVILTSEKAAFTGGLRALESRYYLQTPIRIGDQIVPYGTELTFDTNTHITIISAGIFSISHSETSLLISSSTQAGTYVLK